MIPKLLYFLIPAALLVASGLVIALWDRSSLRPFPRVESGDGESEGAFRVFYHVLWVLMLWSGMSLSLPLWISYREKILDVALRDRWPLIAKVMVFPAILLVLLWYGGRQGYFKWIDGQSWPDEENK